MVVLCCFYTSIRIAYKIISVLPKNLESFGKREFIYNYLVNASKYSSHHKAARKCYFPQITVVEK